MKPRIIVSTKNAREDITTSRNGEDETRQEKAKQNQETSHSTFNKNYQIKHLTGIILTFL